MLVIIKSKKGEVQEIVVDDKKIIELGLGTILISSKVVYANPMTKALFPLIKMLQDLSEPVAYGFMVKGFLQMMAGDDHVGQKTIKSAVSGYLGIKLIPKVFEIIRGLSL